MLKISKNWYFYWLGCLLGGVILGFLVVKYSPQNLNVLSGPAILEPLAASNFISPSTTAQPQPELVTILFTGDVMLGRSVNTRIQTSGDPSWPFIYVKDVLQDADITYINLETPLVSGCPLTDTRMKFCGDIGNVAGLVESGVDVASLANNHTSNYGTAGLAETEHVLTSHNIAVTGLGSPATITKGSTTYTFYSYNDIGSDALKNIIKFPQQDNELVIVTFHFGAEYQSVPNQRQIELAHLAVDNGADLVIGAHPHWVQTKEVYKDKPIYYSLGNFVFDQEWSAETKRGLAVRFTFDETKLVKTEELPVLIENFGQPRLEIH
jgi:poly-gamma-glutamate synthesis protein (capsule biosynthesis protein)